MIWLIPLTIASAVSYRLGGIGGGPWYFNTKMRDWGCSVCVLLGCYAFGFEPDWWWLLSFLLMWAGLSSYHGWVNKLTGHETEDELWYHYFLHGLGIGMALIPVMPGWHVFARAVVLGLLMATSVLIGRDWLDEGLRGTWIVLTMFLFLV